MKATQKSKVKVPDFLCDQRRHQTGWRNKFLLFQVNMISFFGNSTLNNQSILYFRISMQTEKCTEALVLRFPKTKYINHVNVPKTSLEYIF